MQHWFLDDNCDNDTTCCELVAFFRLALVFNTSQTSSGGERIASFGCREPSLGAERV